MGKKSIIAIALLAAVLATLTCVWFQIDGTPAPDRQLLRDICFLVAAIVVPDRIAGTISEISAEFEEIKELERQQLVLDRKSGVRQFRDQEAAMRHASSNMVSAKEVLNTVLYGERRRSGGHTALYGQWMKLKLAMLEAGKCVYVEIVSKHLPISHPQMKVMDKLHRLGKQIYDARVIDDRASPMPQMTIFTLDDGRKEMILGWDSYQGPCFLVTDEALISFHETLFRRHLGIGAEWKKPRGRF